MSSLGGVFRSGMFVGPFLAAWLIGMTGDPQINFLAFIACSFLVFIVLPPFPCAATPSRAPQSPW